MFLLNEMVPCPESDQVCVVGWRRYGHTARTPNIRMAQLVRQHLKVVGGKMVVIP